VDEILAMLMKLAGAQARDSENDYDKREIGRMTQDEIEESNCINAETERLNKLVSSLMFDKNALDTRKKMFWINMRRRHGFQEVETLHIENDAIFEMVEKPKPEEV